MSETVSKELRERIEFADKIKISPYEEVKKNLDEAAASTAKQAASGLVKLFESLGSDTHE